MTNEIQKKLIMRLSDSEKFGEFQPHNESSPRCNSAKDRMFRSFRISRHPSINTVISLIITLLLCNTHLIQASQTSIPRSIFSSRRFGVDNNKTTSHKNNHSKKLRVVVFEYPGGTDKGPDGHRGDTLPIVDALQRIGCEAEVVLYNDDDAEQIFDYVRENADCFVNRINPGTIPNGEAKCFDMFRKLSKTGVVPLPHPDTMIRFGTKDALAKLRGTGLVPSCIRNYFSRHDFKTNFRRTLASGPRVLKQNRGCVGEGVWRVELLEEGPKQQGQPLPLSAKVKCTHAVDNDVQIRDLGEFLDYFSASYLIEDVDDHDSSMVIDMKYLPRIKEGEMRILMVGSKPLYVVHKKPMGGADAFSATLFSGAKYSYDDPEDWSDLVNHFVKNLTVLRERLLGSKDADLPPLWTADFICDWDKHGNDAYYLSEINCSCVGFTSHLDCGIQEFVAEEIVRIISHHRRKALHVNF